MPKIGFKHSKESKEKMRLAALGNSKGGMTGKHHSEESNEKNRRSHLGKVPWNKGKLKENAKRRNRRKDSKKPKKPISESTRKKLSESHKGLPSGNKGHFKNKDTKQKSRSAPDRLVHNPNWNRVRRICKGCGIEFEIFPSQIKYGYGIFHSRSCQRRYEVKENCPSWKGGIAPLHKVIRMSQEMKDWRKAIFERDGYKDWFSGCKGDVVPHHIKKFSKILQENNIKTFEQAQACKELWDINNGVTMLRKSHRAHHEMWGW